MTNKRSIFYDLPPHVFQDIVAKQRSKYILALPFMKVGILISTLYLLLGIVTFIYSVVLSSALLKEK